MPRILTYFGDDELPTSKAEERQQLVAKQKIRWVLHHVISWNPNKTLMGYILVIYIYIYIFISIPIYIYIIYHMSHCRCIYFIFWAHLLSVVGDNNPHLRRNFAAQITRGVRRTVRSKAAEAMPDVGALVRCE